MPTRPVGFELGTARVTAPDGSVCEICVWRADTPDQRSRGLMEVTDLGPAVGMTFRYDELRRGRFWMKNTVIPLSIAFFGLGGELVDAFDMDPCTSDRCPRFASSDPYDLAIEVRRGELESLGITEGSRLELTDRPCEDPSSSVGARSQATPAPIGPNVGR